MNNVICPNCGKEVELTQAFKHGIEEKIRAEEKDKYQKELEEAKKQAIDQSTKRLQEQFAQQIKLAREDSAAKDQQIKELIAQISKLNDTVRQSKKEKDEAEIQMQKKLLEERAKIQEEVSKLEKEKSNLELAEIKKQLEDTKKALEEAQRKAAQKSQQLQGEILELDLENLLRSSFPHDEIIPIGKGISGADIRQIVKSPRGRVCGVILWESKRTKEWRDVWIAKLKEDLRSEKANIPVIVSSILPKEIKEEFGQKEGVLICTYALTLPVAALLRKNLLDVEYQKVVSENRGDKAELLYSYITGHEFRQQVENIIEAHKEMQEQIMKERISFEKFWKQRETQAQRIIISAANIIGSMQGKIGSSTLTIKGLDLPELEEGNNNGEIKT